MGMIGWDWWKDHWKWKDQEIDSPRCWFIYLQGEQSKNSDLYKDREHVLNIFKDEQSVSRWFKQEAAVIDGTHGDRPRRLLSFEGRRKRDAPVRHWRAWKKFTTPPGQAFRSEQQPRTAHPGELQRHLWSQRGQVQEHDQNKGKEDFADERPF